jgi:hypothetical protein
MIMMMIDDHGVGHDESPPAAVADVTDDDSSVAVDFVTEDKDYLCIAVLTKKAVPATGYRVKV